MEFYGKRSCLAPCVSFESPCLGFPPSPLCQLVTYMKINDYAHAPTTTIGLVNTGLWQKEGTHNPMQKHKVPRSSGRLLSGNPRRAPSLGYGHCLPPTHTYAHTCNREIGHLASGIPQTTWSYCAWLQKDFSSPLTLNLPHVIPLPKVQARNQFIQQEITYFLPLIAHYQHNIEKLWLS